MLLTHMLAKGEVNGMFWLCGLPLYVAVGAMVGYHEFGTAGEYTAYAVGAADLVIGFLTATADGRRDAKLVRNAKKSTAKHFEELDKRLKEQNLEARNKSMRDYEYWFQDVIKEYGLKKKGALDRVGDAELCGVPVLAKKGTIMIFFEDGNMVVMDPEKTGSGDSIVEAFDGDNNIVDARSLIPHIGEPAIRYIHDKGVERGARSIPGDTEEEAEIWVFNFQDISKENLEHLSDLENLSEEFRDSETPRAERITNAKKAMAASQVDWIHFFFPAVLMYITRLENGVCYIFGIEYCDNVILENLMTLDD